jgi:hypothetical protein
MKMRKWIFFLAAAALTASAAAVDYDLEKIREDNARLIREWCQAGWDNAVYGKEVDVAGLLEKYSYLSDDPALLAFLRERRDAAAGPREARVLHYLYRDLATTYEAKRVAALEDEMDNRNASDYLWVRGFDERLPVRNVYVTMRDTDDEDLYMNLYYAASNYAVNVLNPLREERLRVHHASTRAAGYESYSDFYYQMLGYEPGVPAAQARKFRDATWPLYKDLVTERCRGLYGTAPAETPPWQSKNIYWGTDFDAYFPKETFLEFTYDFYAGLGMDVRELDNVTVDDVDRPAKEPRAACWGFDAPYDVRVNLKPVGGADDYEAAFHEFGHAVHAAYADPALPYEFRMLGSNELTETYAIFFEQTFHDRAFLREELGMPEEALDDFLRYKLITDMGSARGIAFDCYYDEALHSGELEDPLAYYDAELDKQRLFPKYPCNVEATYLSVDEGFYALYYMAAFYGVAQLRAEVVERFGERWYKDPAAGEFFRDLFRRGDSWTLAEMLQYLGYEEGLNPDYLIADYQSRYDELQK